MIQKEEIFVNESHWRNMTPIELEHFAWKIFQYYRENGFPYYDTSHESRSKEFEKLMSYDSTNLIDDEGVVKQTMHGLGLAWSYFPESFNVKCGNKISPLEAFNDDIIFMNIIRKRLKMGTYVSDSGIRKMIKMYSGVQGVSNFRPTAAAAIYNRYAPNGVVWDMSGGWGGRLLGAISGGVKEYYATEPSKHAFDGLHDLAEDFFPDFNYNIFKTGSETWIPEKNMFDLCFTSPPYFDLEKYSDEPSQSYIKYGTKKEWVDGFLYQTFENCYHGLKKDKYMLINIADPKSNGKISLEEETINTALKVGFTYNGFLKLQLSNPMSKNRSGAFKYEPIFKFKK
jgi:hypothetical protein